MSTTDSPTGMNEGTDPDMKAFASGVASADDKYQSPEYEQEKEDVARWQKDVRDAREFDKYAREEYARNRRYVTASRGKYSVQVPIAPAYIDVLQSFLYARNPAVSIYPSPMTEPPPQKAIYAMVMEQFQDAQNQNYQQTRQLAQLGQQATQSANPNMVAKLRAIGQKVLGGIGQGGNSPPPDEQGLPAPPPPVSPDDPQIQQAVEQLLEPYRKSRDDAKQFSQTMEIVITHLWDKAFLKERAKMMVKSGLSIGVGWMKCFWVERMGKDPTVLREIRDVQNQIAQISATRELLATDESSNPEADRALLQQQLNGLYAKVQVVVARGFVCDFVAAEDIQISTEVPSLALYRDARWIAHRSYITMRQCIAEYPDIEPAKIKKATCYYPKKPRNKRNDDTGAYTRSNDDTTVRSTDADYYTSANEANGGEKGGTGMVMRWEIWDLESGNVITLLDGLDCYLKKPYVPDQSTTRGHPFFLYCIGIVDGDRHPFSLIARSETLFDEYNSVRTNFREARRRSIPKTAYSRHAIETEEAQKLAEATTGEMVGITMLDPSMPIANALVPVAYNHIDQSLYDTSTIRAELEMIWGIQEALSSSIHTAKTATETEVQQQGTQSRNGYMIDDLDTVFGDLSQYTAEIAVQVLSEDDVRGIAGQFALWEPSLGVEDLNAMLTIGIDAGSSGKPKTAIQQQAWAQILPMLKTLITEIGQLLGSDPEEIAECLEELARETAKRTGDSIDIDQFLPDPPSTPMPKPKPTPPPMIDSALAGPQTAELVEICQQLAAGLMTADEATGLIGIAYPHAPMPAVQAMVSGALKRLSTRPPGILPPSTRNTPELPKAPDVPQPVDGVAPLPAAP